MKYLFLYDCGNLSIITSFCMCLKLLRQCIFLARFATAIETAVIGVFRASFKMAVFYGLWTWLIHNLFDVKVIYLPSGKSQTEL